MTYAEFVQALRELWPHLVAGAALFIDLLASTHAVMYKRDSRAAAGWLGVIWFAPVLGALLYLWLGINRVQRRGLTRRRKKGGGKSSAADSACFPVKLLQSVAPQAPHLAALEKLVAQTTGRPLLAGNRVTPLVGGDEAYPAMLAAIDLAERSIALATYIFDNDRIGQQFIDALSRAIARGVKVCVLIDDIGAHYSWWPVDRRLKAGGCKVARFMPSLVPTWFAYSNLRSHRKLLIVDGQVGFTGGMNIREGHMHSLKTRHPVVDLHFRIDGPVVAQMQEVFVEDWAFASGEVLQGDRWFAQLAPAGDVAARGVSSGPDKDHDKLRLTLLGALACAQTSVEIVTPYFLPDAPLITAMNIAAMRGVQVDIVLSANNNLRLVKWASTALWWQVLERGCRIWLTPGPFDHTKLMIVDGAWTLLGSANWDPRSLRLNFEFNVECYDADLAAQLMKLVEQKRKQAHLVTLAEVDARGFLRRLRDGLARLLTPYL